MVDIIVLSDSQLRVGDALYQCAIGKAGFVEANVKQEGDLKTPKGVYALRECWYRADKVQQPSTHLPLREISHADGWCDDSIHKDYNRHVTLPFDASHETLWRDQDDCYDVIVPIGYNDQQPEAGRGSAIFLHVAKPDFSGTEGCVAMAKQDLQEILGLLGTESQIRIMF